MDRNDILARALRAAGRAETLAEHAASVAHHPDRDHKAAQFAAAGTAWAEASRALTAIAEALPEAADKTEGV